MEVTDAKLGENLKRAATARKIREAITQTLGKTAIFTQPSKEEKNINIQGNGNRALFDDATFDRLGVPHEVAREEQEEIER